MKINTSYYLFLILLLLCSHPGLGQGKLLRGEKWEKFSDAGKSADFYVAPNGNDQWSGTLAEPNSTNTDGPFASINRAQQAVRSLKTKVYIPKGEPVETRWIGSPHPFGKGKDILVYIREGLYSLEETLVFGPEDGGERIETNLPTGAFEYHKLKDHYVTYAAYPGEKPVISGGQRLQSWEKERKAWKIRNLNIPVKMLVVDGRKQTLARAPDSGYFVPPKLSETPDKLHFNKGEIRQWKEMEGNRVFMLLRWHHGTNSISRVDEKSGTAWLSKPEEGVAIVPPRYYIENVKALMDSPGEWFYDQKRNELSYIPQTGQEALNTSTVIAPEINELVVVKGKQGRPVRNLRIYGLSFEAALPGSSAMIYEYAHGCELVASSLSSCGGTGLSIRNGCYQTRILENTFQTIDNMAISIHGPDGPADGKDILRETTISYNNIVDCGGINIDASFSLFTTISHNYITLTRGRYAISVGGWRNLEEAIDGGYVVEYNHLDDVQKDADDSGAIKTAGTTFSSVVRKNLVHDVRAGYFNDNVGFWFDNMSLEWLTEDNIFYNLEQGEMKLCAANLVDNLYRNNYVIEEPPNAPEKIITGDPEFQYNDLKISSLGETDSLRIPAGSVISVSANVFNSGSSGISPVELYLDGKILEKKSFPVISSNSRRITFELRIYDEGSHALAIGTTPYKNIRIEGEKPAVVFEEMQLSDTSILSGESLRVKVLAKNLLPHPSDEMAILYLNNKEYASQSVHLEGNEARELSFEISPGSGKYTVRMGNSNEIKLGISDWVRIKPDQEELFTYCSAKAKPFNIEADPETNTFEISAGGSDFFHAEDSYASVFLKQIKGDFVATVKINKFGDRTHEWFRAGLFARNDMTQSFDTQPGSKGSMLLFGTPGRAGINYDEFGNGCMHKANSQNLPEDLEFPIWLKLARHGNQFTGSISLDGLTWINEKRSKDIPGLAEAIDLGLAAGAPDKKQYWVEFKDWTIKVAK
jgi:regulation of enolase protein 1 (concanavalin A-like superfamily)